VTEQVVLAFRWYLVIQLFGLAALPLTLSLFRRLPDRGYGVSKPLGLLLTGWVFWMLTTLGWLHNTVGGILVALVFTAAAGGALYLVNCKTDRSPIRLSWGNVLAVELVFALAFAAWCLVRASAPRIETAGGEKWMEIAFLRAILRSDTFPPHDPWLSGFAISYYYFGYIIVAMLTRLASISPSIAFNLGLAMLFALTCAGAFSLVYNLVAAGDRRRRQNPSPRVFLASLLGPLLLAVMGNLEGLLEVLHARGIGSPSFWSWLDVIQEPVPSLSAGQWAPQRFFWWWQASRVVRDYTPWGDSQMVIDEFPAFSFLLGDMHPHVLALPFVLLVLALALNLYRRVSMGLGLRELKLFRWTIPFPLQPWEFFIYAVCLGGLGFLNTWDFPIYLFVVAAAYALALRAARRHSPTGRAKIAFDISGFLSLFISLLIVGVLLYLPFWITFRSQAGGILPNLFNGTRLTQFLVMFGPLFFIAVAFIASRARQSGVRLREMAGWTLAVVFSISLLLLLLSGAVVFLAQRGLIPSEGPISYVKSWLEDGSIPGAGEVPGPLGLVRNRILLDPAFVGSASDVPLWGIIVRSVIASPVWTALGLVALIVAVVLILRWRSSDQQRSLPGVCGFVLLLFATGALLAVSVEYVYLKDHFLTRMNTVFKFYFQAWVLWAVAGAYALSYFVRRVGKGAHTKLEGVSQISHEFHELTRRKEGKLVKFMQFVAKKHAAICTPPTCRYARGKVALIVAAILIAAGSIYLALAIPKRAQEQGGSFTLDGAAYLARARPDDYAAIAWLNDNVEGAPVVLEAPADRHRAYVYEGRVSAHTGLPTLLGWAGHESQWRGDYAEQERRETDIETLYSSLDAGATLALLDKYEVDYVYVGPVERERYPSEGLAKFAHLLEVAYEGGAVTIYRVR